MKKEGQMGLNDFQQLQVDATIEGVKTLINDKFLTKEDAKNYFVTKKSAKIAMGVTVSALGGFLANGVTDVGVLQSLVGLLLGG